MLNILFSVGVYVNAMAVAAKKYIPVSDLKDIFMRATLKHPTTLFCTSCQVSMEMSITTETQMKLTCPECHQFINLQNGLITNLPLDSSLLKLFKLINDPSKNWLNIPSSLQMKQECQDYCAACLDGEVSFFCTICNDYLCSPCKAAHKGTKAVTDHKVLYIVGTKGVRKVSCEKHGEKTKDFFCETCKVILCSACVSVDHKEHTVYPYLTHYFDRRDKLKSLSSQLSTVFHVPLHYGLGGTKSTSRDILADIADLNEIVPKKIDDIAQSAIADITLHSGALFKVGKLKKEAKEQIEAGVKSAVAEIEQEKEELKKTVLHHHSDISVILYADILRKKCEEYIWSEDPIFLLVSETIVSREIQHTLDEAEGETFEKLTPESSYVYADFVEESVDDYFGCLVRKKLQTYAPDGFSESDLDHEI